MKMTPNGKLLLKLTGALAVISFGTAAFANQASFFGIWMAGMSVVSAFGTILCAGGCIMDTLLENEE